LPHQDWRRSRDRLGVGTYLPADLPEYFTVTPGQKIAAIRAAADGSLFITELS
jgi:hypothetical protein